MTSLRYYLDKFNRPRDFATGRSLRRDSLPRDAVLVVSRDQAAKGLGVAGDPIPGQPPPSGRVVASPASSHVQTSHAVGVSLDGALDAADELPTYHSPGPPASMPSEPQVAVHPSRPATPPPVSDEGADVYPDVETSAETSAGSELDAFDVGGSPGTKRDVGDDELALVTSIVEPLAARVCSPSGTLIPFTADESERFRNAIREVLARRTPAWLDQYGDLAMLAMCLYTAAAVRGRAPAPPAMIEALGGRLVVVELDGERVAMPVEQARARGLVKSSPTAPATEAKADVDVSRDVAPTTPPAA